MRSKYAIIGLKSKPSEIYENFFLTIFRMFMMKQKGTGVWFLGKLRKNRFEGDLKFKIEVKYK